MKIVFTSYVSSPEYNQPQTWLQRISGYTGILESLARDHTVVGIERINFEGQYTQNGVGYHFIRLKRKTVIFPIRLHRIVKKEKPDVVIINGFIFPLQVIQLRRKLGDKVKIIIFHRSEKPSRGIKKYLQRWASKSVNAFLFTSSEFSKEWLENGNIDKATKIHEVMHGSSRFLPMDKTAARLITDVKGCPAFLWVGRLNKNKDPITVVKAFNEFLSIQPSAVLYMIYQTEELLPVIKELIAQDEKSIASVRLVGRIPHEQLQPWYNSADFIISGSHYEGGGIAICEAMSCGCVPIITDIISFRRLTGPAKCGFLYKPGDWEELLNQLIKAAKSNWGAERDKTLKQFKEELSFDAIGKKINQVITTL